jgi:hypothetical protein
MRPTFGFVFVLFLTIASTAQFSNQPSEVPAHHNTAPAKGQKLPHILAGDELTGPNFQHAYQVKAYQLAAKIPGVLYQQPCYCFCDRSAGHKSLRSCFESDHGAHCSTCMAEAYYAYQQTKAGKTPQQIRAGIVRGDFKKIDMEQAAKAN